MAAARRISNQGVFTRTCAEICHFLANHVASQLTHRNEEKPELRLAEVFTLTNKNKNHTS